MSEFRRFMSYIYSYHKAEKLKNTGFAKIEARDEICRMEIHIKGAYPMASAQSNVYGFYEDKGLLIGIYLGSFGIRNGAGDIRIIMDRNNMGDTQKSLEELQGIYLTLNGEEENAMASTWDNIKVDTSYFKVFSEEIEEPPLLERKEEPSSTASASEYMGEMQKEPEQSEESQHAGKQESAAAGKAADEAEESYEAKETEAEEVVENAQEAEMQAQEAQVEEAQAQQAQAEEKQTIAAEEEKEVLRAAEAVLMEQSCTCAELDFSVENFAQNHQTCGLEQWKKMLREYPVVNPFDYLDDVEVIKIEPKDLAKLEKKYWILANNSFLLHGYCSYRYLILARNIKENTFFIGIPGIFHPREKMMAGMFGFSQFQMSRSGHLRQGEFGYYIRSVELE